MRLWQVVNNIALHSRLHCEVYHWNKVRALGVLELIPVEHHVEWSLALDLVILYLIYFQLCSMFVSVYSSLQEAPSCGVFRLSFTDKQEILTSQVRTLLETSGESGSSQVRTLLETSGESGSSQVRTLLETSGESGSCNRKS